METELKKRQVLRLSNEASHRLTKECICTALIFLMEKQPFEKITITSIIERSGVSRAAFYRNYSSKEDVMKEIFAEVANLLSASFNKAFNGQEIDKMQWLIEALTSVKQNREMSILIQKANLPYTDIFDSALGNSLGLVLTQEEKYRAHGAYSAMWTIVMEWVQNGMVEPEEKIAQIILDTIII